MTVAIISRNQYPVYLLINIKSEYHFWNKENLGQWISSRPINKTIEIIAASSSFLSLFLLPICSFIYGIITLHSQIVRKVSLSKKYYNE